jgi:fucose permease
MDNVKLTVRCCHLGMFTQAVVINLTPVLFIPFREQLGLTFEQVGRLVLINFATQVGFDVTCAGLVDRLGAKWFAVIANVLAAVGLLVFAIAPAFMDDPYAGLMVGTIIFSMGAGIIELVLSPIINSIPSDRKGADMSLLHSFYAIGQVTVIAVTALALLALGHQRWRWIAVAWALVPTVAALGFCKIRIGRLVEEHKRHKLRQLIRIPAYLGAVVALGLAGATEVALAQWASAFVEKGLGFSKIVADLAGLCLFAVGLGAGRVWFGVKGGRVDMYRVMLIGACVSVIAYVTASLSPWPLVSLIACAMGGLGVSLQWPGMLTVTAARFPLAGASMFAMMSAAGDTGAAVVPWLVGVVADRAKTLQACVASLFAQPLTPEQVGLRTGLLIGAIPPLLMIALLLWLRASARRSAHGK